MAIIRGCTEGVQIHRSHCRRLNARKVKAKIRYERSSKFSSMLEEAVCREMGLPSVIKDSQILGVPGPRMAFLGWSV